MTYEQVWMLYDWAAARDLRAVEFAGPPPPAASTLTDAIRWALAAGHLPARWGGALARDDGLEAQARPTG